jgi:hypothetical protein
MKEASAKGVGSGSAAWVKFLANVSDKELARYIEAWQKSLKVYEQVVMDGGSSYGYDSTTRALAGAYEVQSMREGKA